MKDVESEKVVAIVGPPGLREAFRFLLASVPGVCSLHYETSLEALVGALEPPPDVVLAHFAADKSANQTGYLTPVAVVTLKRRWPKARCVALIDSVQTQAFVLSCGADAAFFDGADPGRLIEAMGLAKDAA